MRDGTASVTAQLVAARRLTFTRVAAPYGDPGADERLSHDVAGGVPTGAPSPMSAYLAARTTFFDRLVVGALDRGVAQFVVAAAGYDGRSLRYAKPGTRWIELDHPDTQRDKRDRLRRLGIGTPHVAFAAADFGTDDVAAALTTAGCDPATATLVLCEGVAVYLDRATLTALLDGLRRAVPVGSTLGISLGIALVGGEAAARRARFQQAVAALGEPVRLELTATEADALLASTGWQLRPPTDERLAAIGCLVADAA